MKFETILVLGLLMIAASAQTRFSWEKQALVNFLPKVAEDQSLDLQYQTTIRRETCKTLWHSHSETTSSCVCRKNYAKINSNYCHKASWSNWGKWSKCIKTEWGGLQTRERVCKSMNKETPGSCVGRGSKSRKCTSVTRDFRIRKNVKDLTGGEIHDLIQAMTQLKNDSSRRGYRNIASWHGWPGRCPWYNKIREHDDNHCSWHDHPLFLPWHRLITLQLELGLSRYLKNKTLGIPYWDWTEHSDNIPYLSRDFLIYDPVLKERVRNPFFKTFIKYKNGHKIYSQRRATLAGLLNDEYIIKGTVRGLLCHDHYNFDEQISSNPHGQIHDCFCIEEFGDCTYSLPYAFYSAFDPAFFLHHSAIDRIFTMRRHLEETKGVSDWTSSRVSGEYLKFKDTFDDIKYSFDWPLSPFCNTSMNPESITNKDGVWTLHKSYYNEQLFGYKYDNFNLGNNYTWKKLLEDYDTQVTRGGYWHDNYFRTDIGVLTKSNCARKDCWTKT